MESWSPPSEDEGSAPQAEQNRQLARHDSLSIQSETDGSAAEVAAPEAEVRAAAPAWPSPKRRGRPRGVAGSAEHRRRLRNVQVDVAVVPAAALAIVPHQAVHGPPPSGPGRALGSDYVLARILPTDVADTLLVSLSNACRRNLTRPDLPVQKLVRHCFGKKSRGATTISAEATLLGCDRRQFSDKVEELASCCFYGFRAYLEGFASTLLVHMEGPNAPEPVAMLWFEMYDETPMHIRTADCGGDDEPGSTHGDRVTGPVKLMQASFGNTPVCTQKVSPSLPETILFYVIYYRGKTRPI
jgi:hypothetical protein